VPAAEDPAVDDHPAAQAGAERHQDEIVDPDPGAVAVLGPGGDIGVVVGHHRQPGLVLEHRP